MIDPLIVIRALHFAATILVAGVAAFSLLVAAPLRHDAGVRPARLAVALAQPLARLLWTSLIVAVGSSAAWLGQVAAGIAGGTWMEAIRDGTASTLLTETQFGWVWALRLLCAAALAGLLWAWRNEEWTSQQRILLVGVATPFIGLLAWTGHAGAASGAGGALHLAADVTHLLAAGAWIGGLVPLVMALAQAGRHEHLLTEAHHVLCRFSNLGVVSVVALLASGMVNTWFLTDHLRGVFGSEYGRLLQTKLVLVLALIGVAAINRLRLLPALSRAGGGAGVRALRRLQRNVAIEIALGCAVSGVVAVLGIIPPAGYQH